MKAMRNSRTRIWPLLTITSNIKKDSFISNVDYKTIGIGFLVRLCTCPTFSSQPKQKRKQTGTAIDS